MDSLKNYLKNWVLKWAHSIHSRVALFLLAFSESSFFPVPPDILLIAILGVGAYHWRYYAVLTLVGSLLGGIFGYLIGWGFYEAIGYKIVEFYNLQETMNSLEIAFSKNVFLAVFTAAFTPIPYKIITISAGLFRVDFFIFIIASFVGRGLRFFIIAYLMRLFGEKISQVIYRYFNIASFVLIIVIIIGFIAIKFLF